MTDANRPAQEQVAICRGCGRQLIGKPYYMGGYAYVPETRERARVNHYGGFVCSRACDYKASVEQHASMPGCSEATRPDCFAMATIRRNWPEHYR